MGVSLRLPWLLFSLPAGALADRLDRRRVMVTMNAARSALIATLALLVALDAVSLPLLYASALVLGFAEVMADNTSQTLLPAVVGREHLERANGRLLSGQIVTDNFLGRPLAGVLLAAALAWPFALSGATAALATLLLLTLTGSFRPSGGAPEGGRAPMRTQIAEGVRWLWRHPLLRPLALSLALVNMAQMATVATYVLYAREVLGLGAFGFAVLTSVGGVGGLLGGLLAARVIRRIGRAGALVALLLIEMNAYATAALASSAYLVGAAMAVLGFGVVLWNVVTVSLRQTIIPDRLLGRVNSVYRLLGWGSIPVGMLLSGGLVSLVESLASREAALRAPYVAALLVGAGVLWYMRRRLNDRAIDAALATAESPAGAAR
jgi:MFS family permease